MRNPSSGAKKRGAGGRVRLTPGRGLLLAVGLLMVFPGGAVKGMQAVHVPNPTGQIGGMAGSDSDQDPVEQEKRLKAINAQRQKSLVADTNKLMKLAEELNAEMNGPHPEALNPEQLRKVAEIEKLAKSVREKMSTSVKGIPVFDAPPLPLH